MTASPPDGPSAWSPAAVLSSGRLFAYSLPSLVSSVAALPMALFIPAFYASDLGLPLAAVGTAIAASRLLDVVTDPLIGYLSDHWSTRWGRRKPWLLLGAPLFTVALWKLFVPGEAADPVHLLVWSAVLYLGFTMMDLPHKAWGAELSPDYDQRSRITSWREGVSTAGQVMLLGSLVLLASRGFESAAGQLRGVALTVVIGLPLALFAALWVVPEHRPLGLRHEARSLWAGLAIAGRTPAFLRMIGCVVFFVSGVAIQGTLHRLVLADVVGGESRFPLMILIENIATLAGIPIWLRVSLRYGKNRTLVAAALWIAALSLPLVFLRAGDTVALMVWIAIRGSSFASILFLANSIAADVIDVDTLASGEQRSGLFFAVWGMTTKLALALGVLLGTILPAALGYEPAAAVTTAAVQARVMLVYGLLPALLMAVGTLFLYRFPITRERHSQLRTEIEVALAESV